MGCDIHSFVEILDTEGWQRYTDLFFSTDEYQEESLSDTPFWYQDYALFSFLAGVRNDFDCKPIHSLKGLPGDSFFLNSEIEDGLTNAAEIQKQPNHSYSWLTLQELLDFDYQQQFYNRIEGKFETYTEFLRPVYFILLDELQILGNPDLIRVVFWFDN